MNRNYKYHEATISICPECNKRIPAKIIFRDNKVYLKKNCEEHGITEELFEVDIEYYLNKRKYDKPGTVSEIQTEIKKGCPWDCGLCPEHDQHTCIGLVEITENCDLNCPVCYAKSDSGSFMSLDRISKMLDFFVQSEGGEAEILQISGGEPTTHPDIIKIIEMARKKKIRYVMLNTNGLRIADDLEFVSDLSKFEGGFEVYLQFDGFDSEIYRTLRGRDILEQKLNAVKVLTMFKIPVTLVVTVQKGLNDHQLGKIIEFGMETEGVRGVNLQPVAYFGRFNKEATSDRITLSGVIRSIENQLPDVFQKGDIVPLPCNVERVGVTYLSKVKGQFVPVTRNVKIEDYLPLIDNTFAFDADRIIKKKVKESVSSIEGTCSCMNFLKDMKSIIPVSFAFKSKKEKLKYINTNTFRISVTSFVDKYNFDLKSMQKECVHILTEDLRRIPFSAYNMFYRD